MKNIVIEPSVATIRVLKDKKKSFTNSDCTILNLLKLKFYLDNKKKQIETENVLHEFSDCFINDIMNLLLSINDNCSKDITENYIDNLIIENCHVFGNKMYQKYKSNAEICWLFSESSVETFYLLNVAFVVCLYCLNTKNEKFIKFPTDIIFNEIQKYSQISESLKPLMLSIYRRMQQNSLIKNENLLNIKNEKLECPNYLKNYIESITFSILNTYVIDSDIPDPYINLSLKKSNIYRFFHLFNDVIIVGCIQLLKKEIEDNFILKKCHLLFDVTSETLCLMTRLSLKIGN